MLDEERREMGAGAGAVEAVDAGGVAHVGDDWRVIDRRVRRLAARRSALDAEEAKLLVVARRMEIHRKLGYGSFDEYLERALGYAPTTGRDRLRVAEALEELPAIRTELEHGAVSFSTVREITRVATRNTEEDWLAHVEGLTVREVEQAVRGRKRGDSPTSRPDPDLEPRVLRIEVPPATYALYRAARRHLETQVGHAITDAQLIAVACRAVLGGAASIGPHGDSAAASDAAASDAAASDAAASDAAASDAAASAAAAPASCSPNLPPHQVAIVVCDDCKRGWHDAPGRSVELAPAEIARVRCDAVELGRVDVGETPPRATWTIAPRRRRAVLARDRHRCPVPGCTSSTFIDVHHIRHREHGGDDRMSNLTALCELHHTLHHDGVICIGGVGGAIVVTHADGRPYGKAPLPDVPPPTWAATE